jgi:4-amino-4-deoxy-L-arabinose transferase-like glycosyltransferase
MTDYITHCYELNMKTKNIQNDFLTLINSLLIVIIVSFLLFRCLNLSPDLVNKHSWGESEYAMWASAYIKDGFIFGMREVDYTMPFINYLPLASFLAAAVSELFDTDLVFTGRVISFLFSVLSVLYLYRLAKIVFDDKLKALLTALVFVVLPINMYYSGMLYNDPIHLFFIIYLTYLFFLKRDAGDIAYYYTSVTVLTLLVLVTKPTTAIIFSLPLLYFYYLEWKGGKFDKKEFTCIASALSLVAAFIVIARVMYPAGYTQETGKIITLDVLMSFDTYLKKAVHQLSFHFQHYYYIYIAALPVVVFSEAKIRYFLFMSIGFFIFYILFIKGALIHQYYSLPLLLPYSIIVVYGMFRYIEFFTRNRIVVTAAVLLLVVLFAPSKKHLYYMFKPEYSTDIMYVADTVKKLKGPNNIFVIAHGHKSFQYYLDVPFEHAKYFANGDVFTVDLIERDKIDLVIISNHEDYSVYAKSIMDAGGFIRFYCSDDYLIYLRGVEYSDVSGCEIKFE